MENHILESRVLVFKEEHGWTAQGLDYDVAAQGNSPEEAVNAFRLSLSMQLVVDHHFKKENPPDVSLAPQKYWDMWSRLHDGGPVEKAKTSEEFPVNLFASRTAVPAMC